MTLDELKALITDKWTAKVLDHDYVNDSRDDVAIEDVTEDGLTLRPKRSWGSQGHTYPTMELSWAREETAATHGYRIEQGPAGRFIYHVTRNKATSRAGANHLVKSFTFIPPKGY